MITVTRASGQVGSKVANELLESGHRVRVLGRSAQTLSRYADGDADIEVGDLADTEWLNDCVRGVDAVFAMVPSKSIFGDCLGVDDARYAQVSFDTMQEVLVGVGFSPDHARRYVGMTRVFNSRELTDPTPRTTQNTTATRFEEFARSLHLSALRAP